MKTRLKVGAGRQAIHIPEDFFPYSSFKGRYFTGQHDDIYVRCILVENETDSAIVISIEVGDLGDIDMWKTRVNGVCGVPKENIFLTVTHNHPAPHISDNQNQEVEDVEKTELFGELTWEAMRQAIEAAKNSLQDAAIGFGTGTCDINVNRDYLDRPHTIIGVNPHGVSDKTVAVVSFKALDGTPIAFLSNYCVHSSIMMSVDIKDGGMYVSGDLVGYTSRFVEEAYDNKVVALWTSGAAGDQDAKYRGIDEITNRRIEDFVPPRTASEAKINPPWARDGIGDAGYILAKAQAAELADEICYVADYIDNEKTDASIQCIQKTYQVKSQKKIGMAKDKRRFDAYEENGYTSLHLSMMRINDIYLIGCQGELTCSLGMMVKYAFAERSKKVFVVTHCNGDVGYMSDPVGYANLTVEARRTVYGRGEVEKTLLSGSLELADSLDTDNAEIE